MKRSLLALLLSAVGLAMPQVAAAETAAAPAKLPQIVTAGHPALAKVNLHAKFSSVDSVCFDFTFEGDLLDPGEILRVTPLELFPSLGGPGFGNGGAEPVAQRTLCVESSVAPDITALFADGKAKDLEVGIETGSVQIASLVVSVTGTSR